MWLFEGHEMASISVKVLSLLLLKFEYSVVASSFLNTDIHQFEKEIKEC